MQALATVVVALCFALVGASAAAAQPGFGGAEAPAQVQAYPPGTPGPFKIANGYTGRCLDSSTDGNMRVYHGRCNSTDPGQRWGWWNGGWLINLRTGLCVAEWRISDGTQIRLANCENVGRYFWTHRNQAIRNTARGTCLVSGLEGSDLRAETCRNSISQAWRVTYW